MVMTQHINHNSRVLYELILLLSDWGFAIVLASFVFMHIGYRFDGVLKLSPAFMCGLFLLALIASCGRLYRKMNGGSNNI